MPNFVLEMNFLRSNQGDINFTATPPTLSLFDYLIEISMRPRCDDTNCARVAQTVCVPPYTEAYLTVDVPKCFNNSNVLLENAERVSSVSVAGAWHFVKIIRLFVKFLISTLM